MAAPVGARAPILPVGSDDDWEQVVEDTSKRFGGEVSTAHQEGVVRGEPDVCMRRGAMTAPVGARAPLVGDDNDWEQVNPSVANMVDDVPRNCWGNVSKVGERLGVFPKATELAVDLRSLSMQGCTIELGSLGELPSRLRILTLIRNTFAKPPDILDMSKRPGALVNLTLQDNSIGGVFDFTHLPSYLQTVVLVRNGFVGYLKFTDLPKTLEEMTVIDDRLEGVVDLTCLPEKLRTLVLKSAMLTGKVVLTRLPMCMKQLEIEWTKCDGGIDVSQLPSLLETLKLANNKLSGKVGRLPDTLTTFTAAGNQFEGEVPECKPRGALAALVNYVWPDR